MQLAPAPSAADDAAEWHIATDDLEQIEDVGPRTDLQVQKEAASELAPVIDESKD